MPQLDPKSLGLVSLLTSLLLPLVLLAVGTVMPNDPARRAWMRGVVYYSLGFFGLLLRGAVPELGLVVVANTLLLVGYAELLHGFRYFFGRPVNRRWMGLLLPYAVATAYFQSVDGGKEWRILVASSALMAVSIAITWEFLLAARHAAASKRDGSQSEKTVLRFVATVFALSSISLGMRSMFFASALVTPPRAGDLRLVQHPGLPERHRDQFHVGGLPAAAGVAAHTAGAPCQ